MHGIVQASIWQAREIPGTALSLAWLWEHHTLAAVHWDRDQPGDFAEGLAPRVYALKACDAKFVIYPANYGDVAYAYVEDPVPHWEEI